MASDERDETTQRLNDLGQLASGVSHHVINAFSAIVSNAEILRLTAGTAEPIDPAKMADVIIHTALEAAGVARRLIDYSRLATAIGTGEVALDRLIVDVVEAERAKGRPGLAWVAEPMPVPPIQGHEPQLRAMLDQLITNAVESMPPEGGTITLATSLDGRGWVALDVIDTASGMPPEIQQRAAEPFFTTKPGRFGVGLNITNGIWRRHRGTMALRSEPGAGTRVRLCVEPQVPSGR